MLCKNFKFIEMRVVSVDVDSNTATHTCKKCGYTVTEPIPKKEDNVENKKTLSI